MFKKGSKYSRKNVGEIYFPGKGRPKGGVKDQVSEEKYDNSPGAVLYHRENNKIYRKNDCVFGPGDIYCSMWSFLNLAGISDSDWTPQFSYWKRPEKLDDGGKNII